MVTSVLLHYTSTESLFPGSYWNSVWTLSFNHGCWTCQWLRSRRPFAAVVPGPDAKVRVRRSFSPARPSFIFPVSNFLPKTFCFGCSLFHDNIWTWQRYPTLSTIFISLLTIGFPKLHGLIALRWNMCSEAAPTFCAACAESASLRRTIMMTRRFRRLSVKR